MIDYQTWVWFTTELEILEIIKSNWGGPIGGLAHWVKDPGDEDEGSIPGLTEWVKDLVWPELWWRLQMQLVSLVAVAMV